MYYYSAFTLTFQSDLPLPSYSQLDTLPVAADVVIKRVQAPLDSSPAFHYQFEKTLHLWAHEGKEIFYYTEEPWDERYIRMYLLDYALIGLFYQRGWFPLHGGSVVMPDGKVLIITGHSGTGKSTTVTQFAAAGHKLLGDDIAVFRFEDDKIFVLPSYPEISVHKHVFDAFKNSFLGIKKINPGGQFTKMGFLPDEVFLNNPFELEAIIFLSQNDSIKPEIRSLSGSLAMQLLREQSLNYISSVENFGLLDTYFRKAVQLCQRCRLNELSYPSSRKIVPLTQLILNNYN